MIAIALVFGVVAFIEFLYLKKKSRKKGTIGMAIGLAGIVMLCMEALFILRDSWTLSMFMEKIFYPVQNAIFANL